MDSDSTHFHNRSRHPRDSQILQASNSSPPALKTNQPVFRIIPGVGSYLHLPAGRSCSRTNHTNSSWRTSAMHGLERPDAGCHIPGTAEFDVGCDDHPQDRKRNCQTTPSRFDPVQIVIRHGYICNAGPVDVCIIIRGCVTVSSAEDRTTGTARDALKALRLWIIREGGGQTVSIREIGCVPELVIGAGVDGIVILGTAVKRHLFETATSEILIGDGRPGIWIDRRDDLVPPSL